MMDMATESVLPVHADCPECPVCHLPVASPLALEPLKDAVRPNMLRCPACGSEWEEHDWSRVAHAWWAAGGWEVIQRDNGGDAVTWDGDMKWRLT
jgi:uncharacterized protein with PIN domain